MVQNARGEDARGDVDRELEVDVERDVDDAVFESRTFVIRLHDNEYVDVGLRRGIAPCFGAEQAQISDVAGELVPSALHEFG
jgi:hypothetical protein